MAEEDEVSRQRRWQRRKALEARCPRCGEKQLKGYSLCAKHVLRERKRGRKRCGAKVKKAATFSDAQLEAMARRAS